MKRWERPGVPHKGWKTQNVIDLSFMGDDVSAECEMCGNQIRYVHIMIHNKYPHAIQAGCVCAKAMAEEYVDPIDVAERGCSPFMREQLAE